MGHGGTCPHFYKWLGTGAPWVEEQLTRNWPNYTDHHKSAHQNGYYCAFTAKKWRARPKNFFPALCARSVPPPTFSPDRSPTFKFVPAPLRLCTRYYNCSWCVNSSRIKKARQNLSDVSLRSSVCRTLQHKCYTLCHNHQPWQLQFGVAARCSCTIVC